MNWLKEWAKPVFVVAVIGILANCADQRFDDMNQRFGDMNQRFGDMNQRFDDMNQRFERMDKQLQVIGQRTYEMNTRLSRIEGHLGIPATAPDGETPSTAPKETESGRDIP